MEKIFVNIGYGFMLIGITIKDILWLRIVLLFGHSFIWLYAYVSGNHFVVFWNTLFIIINIYRIFNLWQERRPYQIPEHLSDLYDNIFSAMKRKEFLDFWAIGKPQEKCDEPIIRDGQKTHSLILILKGNAQVTKNNRPLAVLKRGRFIGDMGFLTGEPASADVVAKGVVVYHAWPNNSLAALKTSRPELFYKIQNIISKDLTLKIKHTSNGLSASPD